MLAIARDQRVTAGRQRWDLELAIGVGDDRSTLEHAPEPCQRDCVRRGSASILVDNATFDGEAFVKSDVDVTACATTGDLREPEPGA